MNKVSYKIIALFFVVIIMVTLSLGYYSIHTMTEKVIGSAQEKLKSNLALSKALLDSEVPGEWSIQDNKLYKGKVRINENYAIIDSINALTADNVTIFQGDTRVATSVTKADGSRAVGTKMSEAVAEATLKQGIGYIGKAEVVGVWNQAAYEPIRNAKGEIIGAFFIGVPNTPYEKMAAEFQNKLILFGLIGLALAVLICYVLARRLSAPLELLAHSADAVAEGDLTIKWDIRNKDEIGTLAKAMTTMVDNLHTMVGSIRECSGQLAPASQEIAASIEETTATSEEISRNMHIVAQDSENGNKAMLEASQTLLHLSSLILIAKNKADAADDSSRKTVVAAEEGKTKVAQTVEKMGYIKEQTIKTCEIATELNQCSQQIRQIINTITAIAAQTDLLALNAAIEAARAGEYGRGFAVVAEEVRKLAEQSHQGAGEIADLVMKVTEKTEYAVSAMTQNVSEVEHGVDIVNSAGNALDSILDAVAETVKAVQDISNITSEEVASSDKIVTLINQISTMIESVAGSVEEVAASANQQSFAMERVSVSAGELNTMTEQLMRAVEKFRT